MPNTVVSVIAILVLVMPFASAGIITSLESKIGGILVTLFGFSMLSVGTGAVGSSTHLKTGIIGGFTFVIGLGMIGGVAFWDSFSRLWNWLK